MCIWFLAEQRTEYKLGSLGLGNMTWESDRAHGGVFGNDCVQWRYRGNAGEEWETIFSGKLKTRWSGPFTIAHVFPYGTVKLSQPDGPNFKVNGHRVKHYFGGDIPSKDCPTMFEDSRVRCFVPVHSSFTFLCLPFVWGNPISLIIID
uniref:Reverse transcriptase domain-containing protein n=1 Tax=Tanacetum cinerariifolium TaxID=118510 RepID=A0A699JQJ4_TANCI|nr:reverse transcriptase domain-containing protein [Tanacetum cinerariifolium]